MTLNSPAFWIIGAFHRELSRLFRGAFGLHRRLRV